MVEYLGQWNPVRWMGDGVSLTLGVKSFWREVDEAIFGVVPPEPPTVGEARLAKFKQIFTSPQMTEEFNKFLRNIFMQLDEKKFYALVTEILDKNLSYEDTYKELLARIGEAKKGTFGTIVAQLQSLKVLKNILGGQIKTLMGDGGGKVNGYCEIGYTGRLIRQIGKQADIELSGKKYVVNEQEKITDHIEAGFPRPYDQFVPLNNYAPLTEHIEKGSLELVTCPIGLHHVPDEKLGDFVQSISDVLAPGGSFLLRDHDARNAEVDALADVVHSVFNAATGETLESEMQELRYFAPLKRWTKLLEAHGFELQPAAPQVQEGDPTENSLYRFVKVGKTREERLAGMETYLRTSKKGYERQQSQTYLTSIEWHIVAIAREYADFVKNHPAHEFPFFKHIQVLTGVFLDSCRDAIRADGIGAVVKSEYMLMNLFMLVSTTLEFAFKGLAMVPLTLGRYGVVNDQDLTTAQCMAKISDEYAEYIKETPFYEFPYFEKIKEMLHAYATRASGHLIANTYLLAVNTLVLAVTGLTSAPLKWMYSGLEPGKIAVVLEDQKGVVKEDAAQGIQVLRADKQTSLKAVELPRYLKLRDLLCRFAHQGVKVASIAGNQSVQVKVKVATDDQQVLNIKGCKALGDIAIPTDKAHKYVRLNVEVPYLSDVLTKLEEKGAEITYVHDF